ncbi:TetR/AcrR family transcriptional regulator [Azospirillum sp. sgz301742]
MRKSPTQGRAWRTIRTIFEATFQILDRDGEKALTTNRVAERAGFSIGTLYQYFPSMDSILLTMIDFERRRITADLEQLLAEAEASDIHPHEIIRRFVRALIDVFGVGGAARRLLLKRAWMLDHTPPAVAAVRQVTERTRTAFARRAHPDFPAPDAATMFVVSRSVLGAIRSAVLEDTGLPGTPEFEESLIRLSVALLECPAASHSRRT